MSTVAGHERAGFCADDSEVKYPAVAAAAAAAAAAAVAAAGAVVDRMQAPIEPR